jgi:hypothetical protein
MVSGDAITSSELSLGFSLGQSGTSSPPGQALNTMLNSCVKVPSLSEEAYFTKKQGALQIH